MIQRDNYSLLLLAGGKSLRMGSDKAELLYEGGAFGDAIYFVTANKNKE